MIEQEKEEQKRQEKELSNLSGFQRMVSQEEILEQLNTQIKIEEEKKTMEQDLKNYKLMLEFNSRRIFPGWNQNHITEKKRRALVESWKLNAQTETTTRVKKLLC